MLLFAGRRKSPCCSSSVEHILLFLSLFFFFPFSSLAIDLLYLFLHFRCRTLSGSPRPKSFKKVHFIKNMRQHDMRNGRYERKQGHPLVNTGSQWTMAGCPSQWSAVDCFSPYRPSRRWADPAHSRHVILTFRYMQTHLYRWHYDPMMFTFFFIEILIWSLSDLIVHSLRKHVCSTQIPHCH